MRGLWTQIHLDLERLDDVALLDEFRRGDDDAVKILIDRYRGLARSKARGYFLAGADRDDVVQEAMVGLYKAIRDFDTNHETPFHAFAEMCVSRQILTAIKGANRHKHQPLNSSISLDSPIDEESGSGTIGDVLVLDHSADPADIVISALEVKQLTATMRAGLTKLESDVLSLYMEGRSYEEIAGALGNHVKAIDNALQRIKRKLKNYLEERKQAG
jgi:RNA polymerase sporulation-specific sigma factor